MQNNREGELYSSIIVKLLETIEANIDGLETPTNGDNTVNNGEALQTAEDAARILKMLLTTGDDTIE